jgi:hypothetical protein
MHDDGRQLAASDGRPAHIDRRERGERALDPDPGERREELIIDREVGAGTIVALTHEHEGWATVTREIVGERTDRSPDPVGQRLLALDAVALAAGGQRCDLLVGHRCDIVGSSRRSGNSPVVADDQPGVEVLDTPEDGIDRPPMRALAAL